MNTRRIMTALLVVVPLGCKTHLEQEMKATGASSAETTRHDQVGPVDVVDDYRVEEIEPPTPAAPNGKRKVTTGRRSEHRAPMAVDIKSASREDYDLHTTLEEDSKFELFGLGLGWWIGIAVALAVAALRVYARLRSKLPILP